MYTVNDVASWFLDKEEMEYVKLKMLIYYSYAWSLVYLNKEKFFYADIEAWSHGPVVLELYYKHKAEGYKDFFLLESKPPKFPQKIEDILDEIWEVYGGYTGELLSKIARSEKPWIDARGGCPPFDPCSNKIEDKAIYDYYSKEEVE